MTVIQKKTDNPIAHLTAEDIEQHRPRAGRHPPGGASTPGARDDAAYIRKVIAASASSSWAAGPSCWSRSSRPPGSRAPPGCRWPRSSRTWRSATTSCTASGTGCATRRSTPPRWEWDHASPAEQWKHSHNELHHTYTNVIGKDNDLGYGIMRVDEDQRWHPLYLAQPLWNFINACFFEYGIAAYDLELGKNLTTKKRRAEPGVPGPRQAGAGRRSASR